MVQGSGFVIQGPGSRVQVSGFRVEGSGSRVQSPEFRVQGSGFRVLGFGFRVEGLRSSWYAGDVSVWFNKPSEDVLFRLGLALGFARAPVLARLSS